MANIKQVNVGGSTFDVEALHFITGSLDTPAQWKTYIDNLVGQGLQLIVDNWNTAKTEPATTAAASTMGKIYLCAGEGALSGSYVEFVTLDKGSSATPRYVWEKIGSTATDLSQYAKKGTYTSAGPSTNATSSAGGQTASGSATISYKKSDAQTGSANGTTSANTGNAGAATVTVTGAGFTGTEATITISANYTPAGSVSTPSFSGGAAASAGAHTHSVTCSGSISAAASTTGNYTPEGSVSAVSASAHSHTVNAATTSTDVVTSVGWKANVPTAIDVSKFNGGSFSGAAAASLTYETGGVTITPSATVYSITGVGTAATASVANGVLTLTNGTAPSRASVTFSGSTTAHKITKWTANSIGTFTAASLGTGFYTAGSAAQIEPGKTTLIYMTGATLSTAGSFSVTPTFTGTKVQLAFTGATVNTSSAGAHTHSVSGTVSQPTFTGTSATISGSVEYTPAGSVSGGQVTLANHSHSYTAPAAHTHSIGLTDTSVTGTAAVAVSAHTHSLSSHTHNVTI